MRAYRPEGWGTVFVNGNQTRKAHYFATDGRSLCGKYAAIGEPRWESNQEDGECPTRTSGTCQACWLKRKKTRGPMRPMSHSGDRS